MNFQKQTVDEEIQEKGRREQEKREQERREQEKREQERREQERREQERREKARITNEALRKLSEETREFIEEDIEVKFVF